MITFSHVDAIPTGNFKGWILSLAIGLTLLTQAVAVRTPLHVFPDEDSTVITQISIDPETVDQYAKVIDASLDETWY